jgi:hypothetical protein
MILALVKACQDQINRSQLIGLGNSTVLGEFLACPARLATPILRVRTCDLRLRSCKNEAKQQQKQWHKPG